MPLTRPSLNRAIIQSQLNRFYSHPIAQVSLGLFLSIATVMFFALVAIKPTLSTMADLIKQTEDKRDEDRKLALKINALAQGQVELAAQQQNASVLDAAVPDSPEFTLLLKQLEKLASERQVVIASLVASQVSSERAPHSGVFLESIPFTVVFNGSYDQLTATLADVRNLQRVVSIDRLDFLPTSDSVTDSNNLNLSIVGRAFAFSPTPIVKKDTSTQ